MSDVHLHLLLNHVPILGTLFALLLGTYGAVRRQPPVVRAAFLALVVCGAASLAAKETGEGAEDAVEEIAGVSERAIHAHEEAAEKATIASIVLALLALGVLVWRRREEALGTGPTVAVLAGAAVVFGLMAWTGNLGGQIRHTEIRGDAGSRAAETPARSETGARRDAERAHE